MKVLFSSLSALVVIGTIAAAAEFPPVDKLPSHPELPDPLVMFDGTPVTTREQWYQDRRPELKALFEYYEYGIAPAPPKNLAGKVEQHDANYFHGKATKDQVTINFGPKGTPPIHLLLVVPNHHKAAPPVFLGLNFFGNHLLLNDPTIALPMIWVPDHRFGSVNNRATEQGRGAQAAAWSIENAIDRGYAIATFYCGDIDPDKNDFTDGVHAAYYKQGQKTPAEHDWGTIRAWAWGLSRAIDYLATRSDINPKRIFATGHSRLGKTALLAAAFDERIALVVPHQSGAGGCALSRNSKYETVAKINRSFPHWFNDTFPKFAGHEDRLPVDQHLLMCLVAPRPIFDTEGELDKGANWESGLVALKAADKVYKFLGSRGLVGTGLVQGNEPVQGPNFGDLLQYRGPTKHMLNQDYWNKMFDYADAYFGKPQ